jgi:hypothetical protein
MAYDKAKWHSEGNFPKGAPPENGGTHIGIFLAWAILRDMVSDELLADAAEDVAAVRERRLTGRTLLFRHLDGVLSEDDLNERGNAFAKHYYKKYMAEFDRIVRKRFPTAYHIGDSWKNYDAIAKIIDKRYAEWQSQDLPAAVTRVAFRAGNGEYAWRRSDLPSAIDAIRRAGLVILGGEVWVARNGAWTGLIPSRQSTVPGVWVWSTSDRRAGESWQQYCDRCASESTDAVAKMAVEDKSDPDVLPDLWFNLAYVGPGSAAAGDA